MSLIPVVPTALAAAQRGLEEIFRTMFGLEVTADGPPEPLPAQALVFGAKLALVHHEGTWELGMYADQDGGFSLARAVLCMEPEEAPDERSVLDAFGEIINMVAGGVKRTAAPHIARELQIGIPFFMGGDECGKLLPRAIAMNAARLHGLEGRAWFTWCDRTALALLDELEATLVAGAAEHLHLGPALGHVEELREALPEGTRHELGPWLDDAVAALTSVLNEEVKSGEAAVLDWLLANVRALRTAHQRGDLHGFSPSARPAPPGAGEALPLSAVERDGETLESLNEFLQETEEGLDKTERQLMAIEQGNAEKDAVHSIFRTFHSAKGLAGFLDLEEIQKLAHVTETLLAQARDGKLALTGAALDVVFDSVALLRELCGYVRTGIEGGTAFASAPSLGGQLARLEAVIRGETPPEIERPRAAAAAEPAAAVEAPKALRETVKVDVELVDRLMEAANALAKAAPRVAGDPELAKACDTVREVVTLMRMVSVSATFQKMSRLVRDLSKKTGKLARVNLVGEDTRVPRNAAEKLGDPLMHMIRNALDHGLETTEERRATAKRPLATITLAARSEPGHVIVELSDDGRGLDVSRILAKAHQKGIVPPDVTPPDKEIFLLIFAPGFSTAEQVTALSGRGVGMDVVKRNIESLGGVIDIESRRGHGTRFQISLPLRA